MSTTRDQHPEYKQYQDPEYKIIDDHVVRFSDICVHEFPMGDVEDPDLYAAQPIWPQNQKLLTVVLTPLKIKSST